MLRRRGFTVLELLVVVGVIGVLISMLAIGFFAVKKSSATKATRVTLANELGMMAELETENNLDAINGPAGVYINGGPAGGIASPNDVEETGAANDRTGLAVQATAAVMAQMMRSPKNAQALAQLPGTQLLSITYPAKTDTVNNYPAGTAPVLLDAWHNPIIYVPPTGLTVYAGGQNVRILSPSKRGFFASAGPDGNFLRGDDNVYSFEN